MLYIWVCTISAIYSQNDFFSRWHILCCCTKLCQVNFSQSDTRVSVTYMLHWLSCPLVFRITFYEKMSTIRTVSPDLCVRRYCSPQTCNHECFYLTLWKAIMVRTHNCMKNKIQTSYDRELVHKKRRPGSACNKSWPRLERISTVCLVVIAMEEGNYCPGL